jgi:AcrR family transcriptional regulator
MAKVKPSPKPATTPLAKPPTSAKARPTAARQKIPVVASAEPEALGARGTARREAMLTAALAVFLEHGYEGASIEEVMRRVGGSKASLYRYFGNKEGLFGDIITMRCEEFMQGFVVPAQADDDIEQTLTRIAQRFVRIFLDPERRELFRIMLAEMPRFPALAQRFYEQGPARARKLLGDYFRRQHEAGRLVCPDPEFIATQFIEMVKANPQHRALLGFEPFLPGRTVEQHIAGVVRLFLHGCAPRPAATR